MTKTKQVYHLLTTNPGATVRELSDRSGIARTPVKSALDRLKAQGKAWVVVKERPHRKPRIVGYWYASDR